jgi:hypothetical protein
MAIDHYDYSHVFKLDVANKTINLTRDSIPMTADDTVYLALMPKLKVAMLDRADGALYACDPVVPITRALGDSLKILALDHFDATHPAGSDVSDQFRIFMPEYNGVGNVAVKNYIPVSGFKLLSNWTSPVTLALVKKPVSSGMRFKVIVFKQSVSDGVAAELPLLKFY